MNSTVKLRSQHVQLTEQQHKATIAPSPQVSSQTTSAQRMYAPRTTGSAAGSYSASGVVLLRSQQQVTTSQVASQALGQVGRALQQMKRELTQSLATTSITLPVVSTRVEQHTRSIRQILNAATVDGRRVLDAQLNVQYEGEVTRTFTIPGVDLKRHRQQEERLRVEFPAQGTAILQFSPDTNNNILMQRMDRDLLPLGVRVSADASGQILFSARESSYQKMQQQVMVTGQGHRYPAGQPNLVRVQPNPQGVEDLTPVLKDRDSVRQTLASVNSYLRQVQQNSDDIKSYQKQLSETVLQGIDSEAQQASVADRLATVHLDEDGFTSTYKTLSAQANVHRQTVVALLM
ncbi:hypothetical protein CSW98_09420 [Vibrio sp. HA2012]|nr:hypothetical protein CSW98_09420 [Vibrio sp. HA2012]